MMSRGVLESRLEIDQLVHSQFADATSGGAMGHGFRAWPLTMKTLKFLVGIPL